MTLDRSAHRWRRRRLRRRLAGLLEPDEALGLVERISINGWWVTTDRALYVMEVPGHPKRLPFREISSVTTDWEARITTIRTRRPEVMIIGTHRRSAVVNQLQRLLASTPGDGLS